MAVLYRVHELVKPRLSACIYKEAFLCQQGTAPMLPPFPQASLTIAAMIARVLAVSLIAARLAAQSPDADSDLTAATAQWIRLLAPPGADDQTAAALSRALGPTWTADRFGNLVKRV